MTLPHFMPSHECKSLFLSVTFFMRLLHYTAIAIESFVCPFSTSPTKCPNSAAAIYGEELQVENDEVFLISVL